MPDVRSIQTSVLELYTDFYGTTWRFSLPEISPKSTGGPEFLIAQK